MNFDHTKSHTLIYVYVLVWCFCIDPLLFTGLRRATFIVLSAKTRTGPVIIYSGHFVVSWSVQMANNKVAYIPQQWFNERQNKNSNAYEQVDRGAFD